MAIFNSYVKLPEGNIQYHSTMIWDPPKHPTGLLLSSAASSWMRSMLHGCQPGRHINMEVDRCVTHVHIIIVIIIIIIVIYIIIYISYIYSWVGTSTVPKNIKGFGYISSRCPFFLSCTCAIRLHQDFSRQAVANMKCKMVLVSTSYTMTRWIPDRCAHDLHSLSTFVSPES